MRGMRADICEPDDKDAVERFKVALKRIGAVLTSSHKLPAFGDMWYFSVGNEEVIVFADTCSIDIEGPEDVVNRLVALSAPDPGREAGG